MNDVQMAAQFYAARDAARFLLGAEYATRIEQWKSLVRVAMADGPRSPLAACLELMEHSRDSAPTQMLIMAATVEMIETGKAVSL